MFDRLRSVHFGGQSAVTATAFVLAVSGCSTKTTSAPSSTSPRPEVTFARPTDWMTATSVDLDNAYYDAAAAARGKGANLVRAGLAVQNPRVRRSMIEQAEALYRAVPPPKNDYSMADYRLIQQASTDLRAMGAAVKAGDDAAFATAYADYLTVSGALDAATSSDNSSSSDDFPNEPPPWDDSMGEPDPPDPVEP